MDGAPWTVHGSATDAEEENYGGSADVSTGGEIVLPLTTDEE